MRIAQPNKEDFQGLYDLIKYYSDRKQMLPKSLDELYRITRGLRVLLDNDDQVIASAHLDLFSPVLAEVKSLAVLPAYVGKGYGRQMLEDCEVEARRLGIERLFALTYEQAFFEKLGFQVIDINSLPEKVFKECVNCPFYENCNEIAVVKYL